MSCGFWFWWVGVLCYLCSDLQSLSPQVEDSGLRPAEDGTFIQPLRKSPSTGGEPQTFWDLSEEEEEEEEEDLLDLFVSDKFSLLI